MTPLNFLTLFFRAVGVLLHLRAIFNFGYLILLISFPALNSYSVSEIFHTLYNALGSGAAGGILMVLSPWFAKFTLWGYREGAA